MLHKPPETQSTCRLLCRILLKCFSAIAGKQITAKIQCTLSSLIGMINVASRTAFCRTVLFFSRLYCSEICTVFCTSAEKQKKKPINQIKILIIDKNFILNIYNIHCFINNNILLFAYFFIFVFFISRL